MTDTSTRKLDGPSQGGGGRKLKPGDLLQDRYEIQDVIGVGGMGTVYRARDRNFKAIRLVAVKEMISQINDPLVRKKIYLNYERESNILATLRHQAVPRIYDYFMRNDRAYLVMEMVPGRDLDSILGETATFVPESTVISWGIELCDVLHYLHTREPEQIIFRDIKPSNIMITPTNHIMLVDFGIAKLFDPMEKNTMIGTQGYSPPDQYRGEATPKVDIYALGATLHHLLTLRDPRMEPPFSFNERPIEDINPNVSPELIAVINKSLEYDSKDRFETAEEMKQALISAGQETGYLSEVAAPTSQIKTQTSIKPVWTFECEDEVRGSAVVQDGTLYIASYDHNLYALDAGNGKFIWKYATSAGIPGKPAITETNLYVGSEDKYLHSVSRRTGSRVWQYPGDGPFRGSPTIAQGHAFIGSDDGYLHAVNLNTGRMAWRADLGGHVRSTPLVTKDYIYIGTEANELICLDFGGNPKWRFRAKRAVSSTPTIKDDMIYFTSVDATLYALDAHTGWANWRFRLGRGSVSSPLVVDKFLYVGAADHLIYCVNAQTSKEVWTYKTDHQVSASPIFYKDAIYVGSVDKHLYCLEANTGQLRWKFPTGAPITGTAAAYNDLIYFGSADNMVYAMLA
ncbi:MAG: PQQ-binding-like beta-propeller repeat protein [Anaerolineales bacterium]